MPRTYPRKFDYEEARARYAAGETQSALAREYGVSPARIGQVVNPELGRRAAERASAYRWACPDCGAPTRNRTRRCINCAALVRSTLVRPDALQCSRCRKWKPDEDFPMNRGGNTTHRGRHSTCRTCLTIIRREYRHRNLEAQRAYDRAYKKRRRETQ